MKKVFVTLTTAGVMLLWFQIAHAVTINEVNSKMSGMSAENAAAHTDGSMLFAFPTPGAGSNKGITYQLYDPAKKQWTSEKTIEGDSVENMRANSTDEATIYSPIPGSANESGEYIVTWLEKYEDDATGTEHDYHYHIYLISSTTGEATQIESLTDVAGNPWKQLQSLRIARIDDDSFFAFWRNEENRITAQKWTKQNGWDASIPGSMKSVAKVKDFQPIVVDERVYLVGRRNNDLRIGRVQNHSGTEVDFLYQTIIDKDHVSTILNVTEGNDGNIYILYKRGQQVKNAIFSTTNGEVKERIAILNDFNVKKVSAVFNNYGMGQYIVAAAGYVKGSKGKTQSYRFAARNIRGWTRDQRLLTRSNEVNQLYQTRIYAYSTGQIRIIFQHQRKWYYASYSSKDQEWSGANRLKKQYGTRRLVQPTSYEPIITADGESSIVLFRTKGNTIEDGRRVNNRSQILRQWIPGETVKGSPLLVLPEGDEIFFYVVNGENHFILIEGDSGIKSIVVKESDLFE